MLNYCMRLLLIKACLGCLHRPFFFIATQFSRIWKLERLIYFYIASNLFIMQGDLKNLSSHIEMEMDSILNMIYAICRNSLELIVFPEFLSTVAAATLDNLCSLLCAFKLETVKISFLSIPH